MNPKDKKRIRRKLYVNREVQNALILRSILHWFFYMCAILLTVVVFTAIRDPSQMAIKLVYQSFVYFSPAIIASVILLPLFVWDILKAGNKVAGPIHRLRNEMATLVAGHDIRELRFRDGDHWIDFAEEFNALSNELMTERRARAKAELELKQASETVTA